MADFILEEVRFDKDSIGQITEELLTDYPIIYILHNTDKRRPDAYIGETDQMPKRMKAHLKDLRRCKMTQTLLIGNQDFHKSATYDFETKLINYFLADEKYKLQNRSQTKQKKTANYANKTYFQQELFPRLWETLRAKNLVNHTIDEIENKDIFKLSPFKTLFTAQQAIKDEVLNFCHQALSDNQHHLFLIEGEAGTGKSVVLSAIMHRLADLSADKGSPFHGVKSRLLVNHSEMLKTYKAIAAGLPNLKKNSFDKPTPFINKGQEVDIVLIDEAHLLLSQSDAYNNFRQDNHLSEILKLAKIVVCIFDSKQVLKVKSHWDKERLSTVIGSELKLHHFHLTDQFRMQGAGAAIDWIDDLVDQRRLSPWPETDGFDFQVVADPSRFKAMIWEKDQILGLSRIIGTFDYEHKKDGNSYLVDPGGINLPWNSTVDNQTWAERPETIHEVGSIYTIQGFDLNYAGVVIGPSVDYDPETDRIVVDPNRYMDRGAKVRRADMDDDTYAQALEQMILNSLNVLLKRGVKGLYLYAVNPRLRDKLLALQAATKSTEE